MTIQLSPGCWQHVGLLLQTSASSIGRRLLHRGLGGNGYFIQDSTHGNGCVCNGLICTEPGPKEPKRKINRKRDEPLTVLARNSRAGVSKLLSLVDPFRRKYFFVSSFIYFCNMLNPIQEIVQE
ncbi:hypothetical protein TNCV_672751 [Trichonephila clavipes]|nr:hypothetical protein TNCV_672751 [Trichonephila clavipes]